MLANYFVHEALESDVQETHLAKMELSKDGKDFLVEDERQDEPCKALREGLYSSCSGCDLASDVQVFDLTGRSAADSKKPAPK